MRPHTYNSDHPHQEEGVTADDHHRHEDGDYKQVAPRVGAAAVGDEEVDDEEGGQHEDPQHLPPHGLGAVQHAVVLSTLLTAATVTCNTHRQCLIIQCSTCQPFTCYSHFPVSIIVGYFKLFHRNLEDVFGSYFHIGN